MLGVVATISMDDSPHSALVGIVVSPDLEIIFDTVKSSRKYNNILQNPKVAIVIGWDNETTVQLEGIASELSGPGAETLKELYFSVFRDGRERAASRPELVHFKITPEWLRYSNFNDPQAVEEMRF